jgi:H+-transporting ATPase
MIRKKSGSRKEKENSIHADKDIDAVVSDDFKFNMEGLTEEEAAKRLTFYGRNELPEKVVPKWYIFVSLLWQPMPIMIWIAIVIEASIENFIDMAILLFIQLANASIGYLRNHQSWRCCSRFKSKFKAFGYCKARWAVENH